MTVTFQKATKTQSRLRMALDGPSGSGKTYTGLIFATALAKGIGNGRVAVIDTERGSAAKYADRFDFDVLALDTFAPQLYREAIDAAEKAGYAVILIDSLTHAWEGEGGVLDLHDQATRRQSSQNSFTAWKDVTPIHRKLVDAILTSSAHIIVTMRSKMDYVQSTENGRTAIKKVGMAPVQRQGIEYEFDIVGDLDTEHTMSITKSRCFAVSDAVVNKPTAEWFKNVKDWLTEGAPMPAPEQRATPAPASTAEQSSVVAPAATAGSIPALLSAAIKAYKYGGGTDPATEKQVALAVSLMSAAFKEHGGDAVRHYFLETVFHVPSTKDLMKNQAGAVIDVFQTQADRLPAFCESVRTAYLVAQGQTEMFGDNGGPGEPAPINES